eukprot:COSAG05_NODE_2018_length_3687_cov_38.539091_6_plen_46_part_00
MDVCLLQWATPHRGDGSVCAVVLQRLRRVMAEEEPQGLTFHYRHP